MSDDERRAEVEAIEAARALRWNVMDPYRNGSDIIVEAQSWRRFQTALNRVRDARGDDDEAGRRWDAPWTDEQVAALAEYQANGRFHEYTCGADSSHGPLTPTRDGWVCESCPYTQGWAHAHATRSTSDDEAGVVYALRCAVSALGAAAVAFRKLDAGNGYPPHIAADNASRAEDAAREALRRYDREREAARSPQGEDHARGDDEAGMRALAELRQAWPNGIPDDVLVAVLSGARSPQSEVGWDGTP